MQLRQLVLTDFRNYQNASVSFAPGLTLVVGANGHGKTNLLEAIGWLATQSSFRGVGADVLVREGCDRSLLQADAEREGRSLTIECEINRSGRNRAFLNRQRVRRSHELLAAVRTTVFSPDDLALLKGGPAGRRRFIDDTLVFETPRHDGVRVEFERIIRQRNALLRQSSGRLDADAAFTLDVWDTKLAAVGDVLGSLRADLVARLEPVVTGAYARLAGPGAAAELVYVARWRGHPEGLLGALREAHDDDVRRGVTTVGPHRDDFVIRLSGHDARTHASQGEQRSLALALRLAAHDIVTKAAGSAPVLLLDDVFSELDPARSAALLRVLPISQSILTTAGAIPPGATPDQVVRVQAGEVRAD
jgi:DNA replication and repair protein RecF